MWTPRATSFSTRAPKTAHPSPSSACAIPFSSRPMTPRCLPIKVRRKKSRNSSPNLPPRRNTESSFDRPAGFLLVLSAEREIKFTPALRWIFYANAPAVCHHNFARDGQAEAGARLGLSGHAKKPVENAIVKILRNPRSVIDDAELHFAVAGLPRLHDDFPSVRGVFDGIVNQVCEYVVDPLPVHEQCR